MNHQRGSIMNCREFVVVLRGLAATAEKILKAIGAKGGLVVHVGCGDGRSGASRPGQVPQRKVHRRPTSRDTGRKKRTAQNRGPGWPVAYAGTPPG